MAFMKERRNVAGAGPDGEFPDRQRYEGGRRVEGDDLLYGQMYHGGCLFIALGQLIKFISP